MAEETATSHYVKLTKDHDEPMEEIRPGELNQPIHIPQLVVQRCHECGQVLHESYEPPTDEPWATGICGCAEDIDSCRTGLLLPCVLFGQNVENLREDIPSSQACMCHAIFVEGGIALATATVLCNGFDPRTSFLIGEGLLFSWWMCGIYTGLFRQSLQKKYHLKDSPCDPCVVHCCMHSCALCQEHREMKGRLSDNAGTPMTPPTLQDMNVTNLSQAHDPLHLPPPDDHSSTAKRAQQPPDARRAFIFLLAPSYASAAPVDHRAPSPPLFQWAINQVGPTIFIIPNFQLQDGGWIRRQAFWIAKQVLQLGMGDAFDDWLIEKIQLLRKGSVIASVIKQLEQILWPDGIFITKHPTHQNPPSSIIQSQSSQSSQWDPPEMEVQKNNETADNFLTDEQQEQETVRRANFVRELIVGKFTFH
ncbi:hypothetical protein AAC387_Pa08g1940 [Persea americana]